MLGSEDHIEKAGVLGSEDHIEKACLDREVWSAWK